MEQNTKRLLIVGGSVAVVGTVIYLITRKKEERIVRPPFTPQTSPTITNPNQNFPQQQQGDNRIVFSKDAVKWYPSWLPPFTLSF
jgi:hypothetical protein